MIKIRVPATSANMGPGFDAFGLALNLYNEFWIGESHEKAPSGFALLPAGSLAGRGAQILAAHLGTSLPPLKIAIKARIPRTRGLGSSATLTVAGLMAANHYLQGQMEARELIRLGTQIEGHPDNVAPALLGGFVISVQENSEVFYLRRMPPKALDIVVGVPQFELKTSQSRKVLPTKVTMADAAFNVGRAGLLAGALITGAYDLLRFGMEDRLHQPYRKPLIPGLVQVMERVLAEGALGACLSGSGPTLLVFCQGHTEEMAALIRESWKAFEIEAKTYHLKVAEKGAQILN